MRMFAFLLTLCFLQPQHVGADSPPPSEGLIDSDIAVQENEQKPREHRNVADYVKYFDAKKVEKYSQKIKRHVVICVPKSKLEAAHATTLVAAQQILNPEEELTVKERAEKVKDGKRWANSGGGEILFLIVDVNNEANAEMLSRLSVSTRIKKPILRGVQFPTNKDMEIYKPTGRYKFSANAVQDLVTGLRMRTLKRVLTSETVKSDGKSDAVTVRLTGKTLRRVVNNPVKDVVLYLYNGKQQRDKFMDKYERVAKQAEKLEAELTFAYIDVSRNGQDVVDTDVSKYPLVAMFPAHAKPNDQPPTLDILDELDDLRYFVDLNRWYKDLATLTQATSGLVVWKEQVPALDANTFQEWVHRFPKFLAMFWTKASGQSRAFRKQFGTALQSVGGPKVIPFVKIDCLLQGELPQENGQPIKAEINRKMCAMHDVTGVPSLVWFDFTKYTGEIEAYNSSWTKLTYEQVTLRGVQEFIKGKNVHAEL